MKTFLHWVFLPVVITAIVLGVLLMCLTHSNKEFAMWDDNPDHWI
jgi:hypothetical protein